MSSQPQTVTIAQARASTATGLLVADTAANIVAALPNPTLAARVASFTVTSGASLTAAQMSLLFPIATKLHAPANSLTLSGSNVFNATQLGNYESLAGFTISPTGSINLSDTTAQIVGVLANHPAWFAQVSSVTLHLDGTSIGAYPAAQLNGLLTHGKAVVFVSSAGHTVLNVAAAAHDLATNAVALNALGTHQALSFSLTNDGSAISAADATSLTTLQGFNPAAHSLYVSDSGANIGAHLAALIGHGFAQIQVASGTLSAPATQLLDPSVRFASGAHAQLASSVTLNAAAASSLAALPALADAAGAVLTVADTAANLVSTSSAWQSAAGAVALSADAVVTANIGTGLSLLAASFGTNFALSGHNLTVSDTLSALVALPMQAASLATAVLLSGNATATAAQFDAFLSMPHSGFAGHTIAVADSAANLLSIAGADLSHVSSVSLTSNAVVSVAQMLILANEPGFSAGGHAVVVADTAANLLTIPSNVLHYASAVELSADAILNAAAAQALTSEAGYTGDAHQLTIADSAATLANLTGPVVAFASGEQVGVSATISAATAAALANLPHLTDAAGVSLTVQDSLTNLLAASSSSLAIAGSVRLSSGSAVVIDVAHAAALAAIPGFSTIGASLTVTDSVAHLAAANTATWASVATTHAVVDSASALAAAVGSPILATASSVALESPEVVTASTAATLAGMPNFTGATQLSVADVTAALIAHATALVGLACPVTVTDSATINVAGAASLAQIAAASNGSFSFGHQILTVADTATDLLALTPAEIALAGAITLNADATLTAAQFNELRAIPNLSLGGHLLTMYDTAPDLAALSGDLSQIASATLSADASVTAQSFSVLTALPNFSVGTHLLTVADTAANLLTIPALHRSEATSVVLSADAIVSGQQAQALTAEPQFSTGGHQLIIADSAEHLLALPNSLLQSASTLELSGNQTVSASVLSQLATLGIKFNEAGYSLTCVDTAQNLASLSGVAAALAHAEVLSSSSVVTAVTAAALASLPNLSLATGVSLTVQDSAANLITLGQNIPSIATVETLPPGGTTTISAAQAVALAALPHFSAAGTTIVVADTVANLTEAGSTVLHVIANTVDVSDTAANLAADAADPIIQNAGSVTLSGNAVVTASVAAQIAAIPHFTAGTFQLEVADTAANIAAQAAAVANVATVTLVNDSGPISAAMANQLAMISASHGLSFQGGDQLLVQDSYAALTNPSNVAGVALASRLGVADTAANLVLASGHDWGALNPSFTLSQNGNVTASVATSLASLGSHFSTGGHLLTVADTAGAVIGAASAINTLHLTANVTDSAANLGAQASDLLNMGANLTNITVSDANPISATAAAGLSSLGNLLTGPEISVADDATNVDASIPGLEALSGHVAITITDNAAEVASYAAGLTALGNHLTIALTDSAPVTATLASALAPVAAQLAPIHLAVTDTGAAIAANAAILAGMGSSIGDVTLSDGNTQTVTTVAELAPLEDRLDAGVRLTAIGTAAEVAARESALTALNANDRLAAVLVLNTTVSDASTHIAALNALSAIVSVTDNAANVDAGLISLSQISHLQTITLTDSGTPTLSMTVATLASCAAILSSIASPYTITINDTAAHIAADLSSGAASDILGHVQQLNQIASSDGQPIVLNQAQILAHNVDDGPGAALSLFTGAVQVTGVDVAHLGQVTALPHAPASVAVTDTSLNIGTDLAQGNSSSILQNIGRVAQITASPDEPVSLTAAQALHPGVDDGPSSAFGIMLNATLDISNSAIANLTQLANLYITPAAIAVTDTGANISADLGSTTSSLVASLPTITTILVGDGATISLDEQQVLTSGVDDGADSVMAKVIGAALNVTQVASGDIATILGLYDAPTSISVTDTAAHVVSNLQDVLTDIGAISAIDISSGTLTLSAGEALESRVDDGLNSLIARVDGHSFYVTGSTVSELAALTSLSFAPTLISVDDSSSNIASDLQSGQSLLAAHITSLGAITVTHGTLNLASATATSILSNSFLDAVLSHLVPETVVSVMNVPVSGLSALAASDWPNLTVSVADTVSNIASDLASGSSVLQENSVFETSVVLTGGGVVGAATLAEMAALPNLQTAGNSLTVCDTAAAILALSPSTIQIAHSVQIVDTASDIATSLDLLQNEFGGALLITATGANPAITVTAAQYLADQPTIDAVSNPGVFIVAGSASSLAAIAGVLDADAAVYTVSVSDSAFNVISNLQNLASAGQKLQVHLSDTSIPANLVAPLLSIPNLAPAGLPVTDSGSQIAALVESGNPGAVSYLNTYGASLSVTSYVSAADAVALEGLTMFSKAGHTLAIWDTAQHLTTPAYAAALSSSAVDGVYLKTNGGTVTLTATQAAELFSIPGFSTSNPSGTPNTLVVSDTAAHIESELAPLTANAGQVSSILVNSTATVSDQVLSDLQGLHATAGAGVSLSVRDTAANIAASSAAQMSGQSIQPASWSLSANGTVTEADALKLAGLAHFTPGPFDLNIALIADTLISVADANTLGTLAGAVSLGSYQLQVAGSAAQLSALSSQALQVVTPRLIDSAADLAAISTNSPLLQGSVEVSGNDMLTAATTAALLNQIHSAGGGNGIAVATLTFDAAHTVVDTVANLRALTLSAGWLNNPSIHADFNLIAQDNAANLVNPSNTAFLSGLTSTTLSGNTTINAGTADALASVSPTIHFDRGSSSITVQDTAANLISINNASGVALANIVELGGPDHVDAADAETLLGISHLVLNTSLMITDSSTNLLDGALENAILSTASGPHVIVQLAGPETLDAQTAESLVSIPGFADAHNMTISDDPSYLLNAANLSAEQMALQVTLASNETVSANMVLRLSEVPHFAPGGFQLELGGNDFADAATLKAIADMGDAFNANGHTVTMTTDVLNLTPQEFANLQSDQISLNGHLLGVLPSDVTVSDTASVMHVAGTGVSGGTVDVYSASGSLLSTTAHAGASFTISANDIGQGQNFSLTETVNGNTSQGAPIVLLDAGAIETSVAAAGGNFAASGGLQVDTGKFISLYQAGSVPSLSYAALVYDPVAHTVALDIPGQGSTVLITLGGTTHPMALDASEILFKLHG